MRYDPVVGDYVNVTGKLKPLVEATAGSGPYKVQSVRPHEGCNLLVLRISGNVGSVAVYFPNCNINIAEPRHTNWREYGF
jgi:hypothetical protein